MAVHLEFIADDLERLRSILAPMSSTDVALEFLEGGDVYLSIDLREPTPEPDEVVAHDADTTVQVTATEPDSERVEESEPERDDDEPPAVPSVGSLTCPEAIIALLEANPGTVFPALKVIQCLPQFADGTIKVTLARLAREGKITKIRPGVFEAL